MDVRYQLDDIDYKILRQLVNDSRVPFSTISKDVNLSDVAVKRRVERLVKKGVLTGFSAGINMNSLGFKHPVFIELRTELPKTNQVIKEISKQDFVSEVFQTIGDYNLMMKVATPSLSKTKAFIDDLAKVDGVLEIKTKIVLKTLKDQRYSSLFSMTQALPFED